MLLLLLLHIPHTETSCSFAEDRFQAVFGCQPPAVTIDSAEFSFLQYSDEDMTQHSFLSHFVHGLVDS